MALTDYVIMPGSDYQALCDKIREKTGKTDVIKSGDLATEIEEVANSGGGSGEDIPAMSGKSKAITFYDVEGNIVYTYTRAEAARLTELPPVPTLGNLEGSWSHTLADIQSAKAFLNVGAIYKKNGHPTIVAVVQLLGKGSVTHTFNIAPYYAATINVYNDINSDVKIATKTISSRSLITFPFSVNSTVSLDKKYYIFELIATQTTCYFGNYTSTYMPFFGTSTSKTSDESRGLLAVTATSNFRCGQYAFIRDFQLKYICCTANDFYASYSPCYCYTLQTVVSSKSTSFNLSSYSFQYCYSIDKLYIGRSAASPNSALASASNLKEVVIGSIDSGGFYISYLGNCSNIIVLSATATPPSHSIPTTAATKITLYLPDDLVDTYKTAWSDISGAIKPLSSYEDF